MEHTSSPLAIIDPSTNSALVLFLKCTHISDAAASSRVREIPSGLLLAISYDTSEQEEKLGTSIDSAILIAAISDAMLTAIVLNVWEELELGAWQAHEIPIAWPRSKVW